MTQQCRCNECDCDLIATKPEYGDLCLACTAGCHGSVPRCSTIPKFEAAEATDER